MPESTRMEGILRSLIEAMEQRECAEPDLPEWEANARLREAENRLLRLYRETGRHSGLRRELAAIEIVTTGESTTVEVA